MSIISAYSAAPGLQNATLSQRAHCTVDKMKNNAKTNLLAGGVSLAGGAAIGATYLNANSKVVQGIGSKVINGGKKLLGESGLEVINNIKSKVKANPKMAATIGVIAAGTAAITGIISHIQTHRNGKIEGQYQAQADIQKNINA